MKSTLLKGTLYLTISSLVFMFSGYIINIWLGRHLGPEAYGVYGIIISLVSVINLAQTSGLPLAVSKYASANNEKSESVYKTGFILQLISSVGASLLFFSLSTVIALLLHDDTLVPYLQVASLIFLSYGLFALITGYYNGLHLFKKQAFIHISYSIIKIFAIIIGAIYFHLYGVLYGFAISSFFALLLGFHIPKSIETFPYKKLIIFSLPLIGIAIFSNLLQSIDLFFVKALMHSDVAPGFYTASQNISRIPFFALSALSVVLFPSISRSVSQNLADETKNLIQKSLRVVFLLLTPLVLIMSATSGELTTLIYSTKYLPAANSLSILLIAIEFLTIFAIQSSILSGAGKPRTPLFISILSIIVTSILCTVLIPLYGLIGAAISTTVGGIVAMLLSSIVIYKKFKTLISIKTIIKIIIPAIIIYLLAKIILVPLFLLPVLYLFLFAIYVGILIVLKEITKDDISLIRSLMPKIILDKIKL